MKKKILFVTKALWIGGIESALINLLNSLDYNKYNVALLITKAELDLVERIHPKCKLLVVDRDATLTFNKSYKFGKLFHLTETTDHPSKFHQLMIWTIPIIKWIENGLYIYYVKSFFKEQYYDTVIIYNDAVAELAIKAIKADKYLMFYHHGEMRHAYHDKIAYKKCKNIIAVSNNLAEKLKKFVPKYSYKIIAIHNFINADQVIEKGKLSCDDIFDCTKYNIVSVGRLSFEKGMDIAVATCKELVDRGFTNIRWWIIGDGPEMQNIKKQVFSYHMEDYISLVGMKKNPYPYIKQADLYVQPSRVEAFGLTIKEAMILKKNIVATNTDGAKEILKNKELLCNADYQSLSNEIEKHITYGSIEINDEFNNEWENELLMEYLQKFL
mgnify:CR=1 FL=1